MSDTRPVRITDEHTSKAQQMVELYKVLPEAVRSAFGFTEETLAKARLKVSCPCGVEPEQHCTTKTGRRARHPHQIRLVAMFAVLYALSEEPIISEEIDIEDVI